MRAKYIRGLIPISSLDPGSASPGDAVITNGQGAMVMGAPAASSPSLADLVRSLGNQGDVLTNTGGYLGMAQMSVSSLAASGSPGDVLQNGACGGVLMGKLPITSLDSTGGTPGDALIVGANSAVAMGKLAVTSLDPGMSNFGDVAQNNGSGGVSLARVSPVGIDTAGASPNDVLKVNGNGVAQFLAP